MPREQSEVIEEGLKNIFMPFYDTALAMEHWAAPRSGVPRMQKLKTYLLRNQSSEVLLERLGDWPKFVFTPDLILCGLSELEAPTNELAN